MTGWGEQLPAERRFDAPVDAGKVASARRWNTGALVVGLVLGVPALALGVALLIRGDSRATLIVLIALLLAVIALLYVPRMLRLRRNLRGVADGGGTAMSITADGVSLPRLPLIRWQDMLGIIYHDDSQRSATVSRSPIVGWGARLALRAGEGRIGVTIGLRDGAAIRSTVRPESDAKLVRLWGGKDDPVRPGDITLPLDATMGAETVRAVVLALRDRAVQHGVPFHTPPNTIEYVKAIARMCDPRWPAGT